MHNGMVIIIPVFPLSSFKTKEIIFYSRWKQVCKLECIPF